LDVLLDEVIQEQVQQIVQQTLDARAVEREQARLAQMPTLQSVPGSMFGKFPPRGGSVLTQPAPSYSPVGSGFPSNFPTRYTGTQTGYPQATSLGSLNENKSMSMPNFYNPGSYRGSLVSNTQQVPMKNPVGHPSGLLHSLQEAPPYSLGAHLDYNPHNEDEEMALHLPTEVLEMIGDDFSGHHSSFQSSQLGHSRIPSAHSSNPIAEDPYDQSMFSSPFPMFNLGMKPSTSSFGYGDQASYGNSRLSGLDMNSSRDFSSLGLSLTNQNRGEEKILVISNLPLYCTENDISTWLRSGKVRFQAGWHILGVYKEERSCLVQFDDEHDMNTVLELNGEYLHGSRVSIYHNSSSGSNLSSLMNNNPTKLLFDPNDEQIPMRGTPPGFHLGTEEIQNHDRYHVEPYLSANDGSLFSSPTLDSRVHSFDDFRTLNNHLRTPIPEREMQPSYPANSGFNSTFYSYGSLFPPGQSLFRDPTPEPEPTPEMTAPVRRLDSLLSRNLGVSEEEAVFMDRFN